MQQPHYHTHVHMEPFQHNAPAAAAAIEAFLRRGGGRGHHPGSIKATENQSKIQFLAIRVRAPWQWQWQWQWQCLWRGPWHWHFEIPALTRPLIPASIILQSVFYNPNHCQVPQWLIMDSVWHTELSIHQNLCSNPSYGLIFSTFSFVKIAIIREFECKCVDICHWP